MADDPNTPATGKADPEAAFTKLLEKHNSDGMALARLLFNENHDLRQKNAEIRGKVPADGSVVLAPDQAKIWSDYQALGKPEDLRKIAREHPELASKVAGFEREKEIANYGEIAHMKPSVLGVLADRDRVAFEVVDGKEKDGDGKPVPVVMVKAGDKAPVPIDDYAKTHWGDFLDALKTSTDAPARPRSTPTTGSHATTTTRASGREQPAPEQAEAAALMSTGRYGIF